MMKIKYDDNGRFYVVTLAKNNQVLQCSESLNTVASVRKHIAAMLKTFSSKGLKVIDETGKFKEYA